LRAVECGRKPESSGTHPAIGFLKNQRLGGQLRQKSPSIGRQGECVKSAKQNGIKVSQMSAIKPKNELSLAPAATQAPDFPLKITA